MAAIGDDIAAQGCHLERHGLGQNSNCSMRNPGGNRPQSSGFGQRHDGIGQGIGANIQIGDLGPDQRIADASADEPCLIPGVSQQ